MPIAVSNMAPGRDKLLIAAIAQSPDQRNATTEQALRDRIAKRWFECSGCNCRSRILCGPRFRCTHGEGAWRH